MLFFVRLGLEEKYCPNKWVSLETGFDHSFYAMRLTFKVPLHRQSYK